MSILKLPLLLLVLSSIFTIQLIDANNSNNRECKHRKYNVDSTVCVCTESYCDDFPSLKKTPEGIVQIYETSKDGLRFHSSQTNFESEMKSENQPDLLIRLELSNSNEESFQKIIGFGGAFTDSAGLNIGKLSKNLQKRLLEDYFGPNGIEYTLSRIPIGGSDFSTRPYSYDDDNPDDDSLDGFQLQAEDFQYKIPYLKMAQEISPNKLKFFASPWSPPAWMKTNNDIRHGGFLKGQPGGKYYKMFAKYLVKFLNSYQQQQNISIWGLTIENEPLAGFDPNYQWNCLGFNSTLERDFLKLDLGPELYLNGYTKDKLQLMIFDDQLPHILSFTETIMQDSEASKYVSGIGLHWYHNYEGNREDLDRIQKKYPDIFILGTEACKLWKNHPKHVYLGSWEAFNDYAEDILKDLNHFVTGWTDWNLVLNPLGGPNWAQNYVDAPIIVNSTSNEYYKQPTFYAMGHFSKFLKPDSIRLKHSIDSNWIPPEKNLDSVMFQRSEDQGIVLIILNQNQQSVMIQVEDGRRGLFQFGLKPQSLTTFLWY